VIERMIPDASGICFARARAGSGGPLCRNHLRPVVRDAHGLRRLRAGV